MRRAYIVKEMSFAAIQEAERLGVHEVHELRATRLNLPASTLPTVWEGTDEALFGLPETSRWRHHLDAFDKYNRTEKDSVLKDILKHIAGGQP